MKTVFLVLAVVEWFFFLTDIVGWVFHIPFFAVHPATFGLTTVVAILVTWAYFHVRKQL